MKSPLSYMRLPVAATLCISLYLTPSSSAVDRQQEKPAEQQSLQSTTVTIPGPLRSFLRMAGISQKATADDVMPLLARNIFLLGYEGSPSRPHPTEFLILVMRYMQQARELQTLGGQQSVIRVSTCEEAKPLLRILGYRTRTDCGQSTTFLETADAQRAFLTIDSGFPLPELEKALQEGRPFTYDYQVSRVPILFTPADWTNGGDMVDTMLRDPSLARLYSAFSQMDPETQVALRQSPGLKRLIALAPVLDFYGSHILTRSGRVVVPGGSAAEPAWKELVGASPDSPGDFVYKMFEKDNGWLAAYFDALSRVTQAQQAHFTDAHRLRHCYDALRGQGTYTEAARSVFRPDPGLLLLLTRLQWEPNGDPHVPGNLEVWKHVLRQKTDTNVVRDWGKRARHWQNSEQLLEGMFGLSRVQTETGPLQAYLMLTELNMKRPPDHRLSPETVALMAGKFSEYSNQYLVFSEFPALDDTSITSFIRIADGLNNIANHTVRGNAMGTFQASTGIWQILARQGEIPASQLNTSWQQLLKPFTKVSSSTQVFDAGRSAVKELLVAATGKPEGSQDDFIELLAGPAQKNPDGQRMHQEVANRMRAVLDGQRLVSLDTLIALGDGLHTVDQVKARSGSLLSLAGALREFEMPQPIFRSSERTQWAAGIYNNRHTEIQMRTDLTKVVKSPASPEQLADARGQLASFLRDTLVGLNYAYYEPPGAQILHHNPLFVRSHDFSGETIMGQELVWQAPQLFGAGSPAGGGAHLVGSLADLPFVLSQVEQDFISPENVQALIWREVVPALLTSAIVPRWWEVTPNELHAVALYQRAGEELLSGASDNEDLRNKVLGILADRMLPQSLSRVNQAIQTKSVAAILPQVTPADTFYLAAEFRQRFPQHTDAFGAAGKELESLLQQYPNEVGWERLSRDFGVPHPVLAQSYARELLNLRPFPAFMGYSSRFLAESWDSNNLYWARLADEKGLSPVMLNRLVPELTHRMVEKIFATDLEDWPALLRAARETGEEFKQGKIASLSVSGAASAP
jgi:hypothetical protein